MPSSCKVIDTYSIEDQLEYQEYQKFCVFDCADAMNDSGLATDRTKRMLNVILVIFLLSIEFHRKGIFRLIPCIRLPTLGSE